MFQLLRGFQPRGFLWQTHQTCSVEMLTVFSSLISALASLTSGLQSSWLWARSWSGLGQTERSWPWSELNYHRRSVASRPPRLEISLSHHLALSINFTWPWLPYTLEQEDMKVAKFSSRSGTLGAGVAWGLGCGGLSAACVCWRRFKRSGAKILQIEIIQIKLFLACEDE